MSENLNNPNTPETPEPEILVDTSPDRILSVEAGGPVFKAREVMSISERVSARIQGLVASLDSLGSLNVQEIRDFKLDRLAHREQRYTERADYHRNKKSLTFVGKWWHETQTVRYDAFRNDAIQSHHVYKEHHKRKYDEHLNRRTERQAILDDYSKRRVVVERRRLERIEAAKKHREVSEQTPTMAGVEEKQRQEQINNLVRDHLNTQSVKDDITRRAVWAVRNRLGT